MDICNSFIGLCNFFGVFPIQYDSRNKDHPFQKAKYFLSRHVLFIILTIYSTISRFIRYQSIQTEQAQELTSFLMNTYGVFNLNFILYTSKILTSFSLTVSLINFSYRGTVDLLNKCATITLPCRGVNTQITFIKWLLFPLMIMSNMLEIGFIVQQVLSHWGVRQYIETFSCLLRTITGFTPFFATMFLFVCMFSTKEKIKSIRGEMENIIFFLEKKQYSKRTAFLPDVGELLSESHHVRREIMLSHLKLKELREQHNDLIFFLQSLNARFQSDVLFIIVLTFYLLLMSTYGLVFNINNFDQINKPIHIEYFICVELLATYQLLLCWMICHGASTIDVESKLLEMSVMKVSLCSTINKLTHLEVQLFYLQCKKRASPFKIFGMFAIGKTFMFMMLTTIISYIAVIIQFTFEAQVELVEKSMMNNTTSINN